MKTPIHSEEFLRDPKLLFRNLYNQKNITVAGRVKSMITVLDYKIGSKEKYT